MENKTPKTNSETTWQQSHIEQLSKALTFAYKTQNTYKEPLDLADRVEGWRFVLEEYNMDQVLYGIKEHMKRSPNMPVPADINLILNPVKPRVTEAQFVQAQKWQAANGYPIFSDAKDVIDEYKAQDTAERDKHVSDSKKIQSLVSNSVKRIT